MKGRAQEVAELRGQLRDYCEDRIAWMTGVAANAYSEETPTLAEGGIAALEDLLSHFGPDSLCPCGEEPSVNGGRGFECRGKSML